jgi:hypothetical protein
VETHEAAQSLDEIEALFAERAKSCLSKRTDKAGMTGGQTFRTTTTYIPKVERAGTAKVEFTLRMDQLPSAMGQPDGGWYVLAADLQSGGGTGTATTLYIWDMTSDEIQNAVRKWAKGENAACPEME